LKEVALARWLILGIFIDSFFFVFSTAIVSQGLGVNNSETICSAAIALCLAFYVTTKVVGNMDTKE
jgi:hypothetical protein